MTEFYDKVIAEIKTHFPNAEIKNPIVIDCDASFGLAKKEPNEPGDKIEYAYSHRDFRFDSGAAQQEAEDYAISEINKLASLRHPDIIFMRNVELFNKRSFSKDGDNWSSWVRFSLGYKL